MSKTFVLMWMLFNHVVDDYYLQGILAQMKQKSWWSENAPGKKYKHDYKMALLMHAMSWSFMTMLPIFVYFQFNVAPEYLFYFFSNTLIHAAVDHLKANKRCINLIEDQCIHLYQIFFLWLTQILLVV